MTRPLRSNFEAGSVREASRRAQWKALGLTDADIEKPKIAVVNSSSELAICFRHLDGVAAIVKEAVWAAGGLPFEIRTDRAERLHHRRGRVGRLHPALARPRRERHGDRRRGRAARRDDLPVLVRQDAARAPHGGGALQHPDDPRHLRLPAVRRARRRARRHRGRLRGRRAGRLRQARRRPAARDGRQRDPRARRVPGHGDGQLDARRRRGAGDGAARRARRCAPTARR